METLLLCSQQVPAEQAPRYSSHLMGSALPRLPGRTSGIFPRISGFETAGAPQGVEINDPV